MNTFIQFLLPFVGWVIITVYGWGSKEKIGPRYHKGRYACKCEAGQCDPAMDQGDCLPGVHCSDPNRMGPGCEFIDAYKMWGLEGLDDLLIDGDNSTCVEQGEELNIKLDKFIFFTWIRIVAEKAKDINPTITTDDVTPAYFTRDRGENEFLIRSREPYVLFKEMTIKDLPAKLCTVQISGGRNVMVEFQTTAQSTFYYDNPQYGAHHAVDDIIQTGFAGGAKCTHTKQDRDIEDQWWTASLQGHTALVHQYKLHNRDEGDKLACRLQRFLLEEYLGGVKQRSYQEESTIGTDKPKLVYDVYASDLNPSGSVRVDNVTIIKRKITTEIDEDTCFNYNVMTICEVQAFGEVLCSGDLVGLSCNSSCDNCDSYCDMSLGCSTCKPGYKGRYCELPCEAGKWGPNCKSTCADGCRYNCSGTGECIACHDTSFSPPCCNKEQSCPGHDKNEETSEEKGSGTLQVALFTAMGLVPLLGCAGAVFFILAKRRGKEEDVPPEEVQSQSQPEKATLEPVPEETPEELEKDKDRKTSAAKSDDEEKLRKESAVSGSSVVTEHGEPEEEEDGQD